MIGRMRLRQLDGEGVARSRWRSHRKTLIDSAKTPDAAHPGFGSHYRIVMNRRWTGANSSDEMQVAGPDVVRLV
jgi:hypothetical protein